MPRGRAVPNCATPPSSRLPKAPCRAPDRRSGDPAAATGRVPAAGWTRDRSRDVEPETAEFHHRQRILADDEETLTDAAHRTAFDFAPIGLAPEAQRIC